MFVSKLLLCLLLARIAGAAKAAMDLSADGKIDHWGNFWSKSKSWTYKYKNGDPKQGPKFWGSTTLLVSWTDGWHLAQSVYIWSFASSLVLWPYTWWSGLLVLVPLMLITFTICYHSGKVVPVMCQRIKEKSL